MANATHIPPCKDSPLSIASSATGFLTTLVAVALAYYAFFNIFHRAPQAYLDFVDDVETFKYQSVSLVEEFGELEPTLLTYLFSSPDFKNFQSLMKLFDSKKEDIELDAYEIRDRVGDPTVRRDLETKEEMKNLGAERPVQQDRNDLESQPPSSGSTARANTIKTRAADNQRIRAHFKSTLSCARIRLGVIWWWQLKDDVSDFKANMAVQVAELSFLERKLIRYHLTYLERRQEGNLVSPVSVRRDPPSESGALQTAAGSGSDLTSTSDELAQHVSSGQSGDDFFGRMKPIRVMSGDIIG